MNYLKAIFLGDSEASLDFYIANNNLKIIESVFKSKQSCGLNTGEIILVDWLHNKSESSEYPQYYKYDYYIDPIKSTSKLMEEGFIRFSTPEEALKSLKVVELKAILESNNLPQSGRKNELIERIVENISVNKFSAYIESRSYVATDKGLEVIDGYKSLISSHKSRRAQEDPANVILFLSAMGNGFSDAEIMSYVSLKQFEQHRKDKNFGLMASCMTRIGEAYDVGGNLRKAISGHLASFIISTSGWMNGGQTFGRRNVRSYQTIGIYALKQSKDYNLGDLDNLFSGIWEAIINFLPKHYLNKEQARKLLWAYVDGDNDKVLEILGPEDTRTFSERLRDTENEINKSDNASKRANLESLKRSTKIDTSAIDLCYPSEGLPKKEVEIEPEIIQRDNHKIVLIIGVILIIASVGAYFFS